jgi:hypothetical protein
MPRTRGARAPSPGDSPADYRCRFIPDTPEARAELVNLYHLAQTPVGRSRLLRMQWAAGMYHRDHPAITALAAYKDLEGLLA